MLNPLIEAMRRETAQLQTGNLSWRTHSQKTEYLRPIESYVENDRQPIFEDFLIENGPYRDRFDEHDRLIEKLEDCALKFYRSVMGSDQFHALVKKALSDYQGKKDAVRRDLASMARDLPKYISEALINNTQVMPSHYTLSRFWEEFRDEFLGYRQRRTFQAVERARKLLEDDSARLGSDLAKLRLMLCREYDLPAAPVEQSKSSQESASPVLWP